MCLVFKSFKPANPPKSVFKMYKVYLLRDGKLMSPYFPFSRSGTITNSGTYEISPISCVLARRPRIHLYRSVSYPFDPEELIDNEINMQGFHCLVNLHEAEFLCAYIESNTPEENSIVVTVDVNPDDILACGETLILGIRNRNLLTYVVSKITITQEEFDTVQENQP